MKATAVIVAAGQGKRLGEETPKQFLNLMGRPLLAHTLAPFELVQEVCEVIVLLPHGWEAFCRREVVEKYGFKKISKMIPGGQERQDSVFQGLKETRVDMPLVMIHDGARPLVTEGQIEASIATATKHGAAIVAIPLADTLKQVGQGGCIQTTLNREGLWLAQTPQVFQRKIIMEAYESAMRDRFYGTDDAALVERAGFEIRVVLGSTTNLKVTTRDDMEIAEHFLRERSRA